MKRSTLGALIAIGGAALTLSCCNGGSFDELEKAPLSYERNSAQHRSQVAACISGALGNFGSDLGTFPDIEPGTTRLLLGGEDSGHYRNYYQIDVIDRVAGSTIYVHRSKGEDPSMPSRDLFSILAHCAG